MKKHSAFRLRLLGLGVSPRLAGQLERTVLQWQKSCGEAWVVERLKNLKQSYINHLGGLAPLRGIRFHKDGTPYGVFRHVWQLPPKVALDVLNLYTMYRCKTPSAKQLSKFHTSVQRPVGDEAFLQLITKELSRRFRSNSMWSDRFQAGYHSKEWYTDSFREDHATVSQLRSVELASWTFSEKRAPASVTEYLTKREIDIPTHEFLYQLHDWSDLPIGRIDPSLKRLEGREPDNVDSRVAGCISYIQEPGQKLRAIANPIRGLQCLLAPLGFGLYNVLKGITEDYTYDHESGVAEVQARIMAGKTVYSYDLSDATNNLPRDLQFALLRSIGVPEIEIQSFSKVCEAHWITPGGWKVRWTVGQPLGVFPSFASFALLHHALLQYAFHSGLLDHQKDQYAQEAYKLGRYGLYIQQKYAYPWAVIGDDVCIWDSQVAHKYHLLMQRLGVPISSEKSIISDRVAEFAKRVITRHGVYLPHKWKPISDDAVKSYLIKTGKTGLLTLTPRQRRIVGPFLQLPQPFGMGWNPEGLTAFQRCGSALYPFYLKNFLPLENDTSTLTDSLAPVKEVDLYWADFWLEKAEGFRGYHHDYPEAFTYNDQLQEDIQKDPLNKDLYAAIYRLRCMSGVGLPISVNLSNMIFRDLLLVKDGNRAHALPGKLFVLRRALELYNEIERNRARQRIMSNKTHPWPAGDRLLRLLREGGVTVPRQRR